MRLPAVHQDPAQREASEAPAAAAKFIDWMVNSEEAGKLLLSEVLLEDPAGKGVDTVTADGGAGRIPDPAEAELVDPR